MDIFPLESSYFYTEYVLFLLNFTAYSLLDFKMYGIVQHRFSPRLNAVFLNIRGSESELVDQANKLHRKT